MTASVKLQQIHGNRTLERRWKRLTMDQRRVVLERIEAEMADRDVLKEMDAVSRGRVRSRELFPQRTR